MLLSSSFMGASPLPTAVFAGLLWMQVMSTAKVTELGGWVNLCKNIVKIERVTSENSEAPEQLHDKQRYIIVTDASKLSIETEPRSTPLDDENDESTLPTLKQLKEMGIIHLDSNSFIESSAICQDLFSRDDLVVNMHEGMKPLIEAPPGAANTSIPKLAEIYQKRQRAIRGQNKRLASMIANAPPMEPAKMLARLGTASMAMGFAVFVLGGGMYLGASAQAEKLDRENRDKYLASHLQKMY